MYPGIESLSVNVTGDCNSLSFSKDFERNANVHGTQVDEHWKTKGEFKEVLDTSHQYFLWCCVQQQMYHYQLLSAAFASSGFEPPRIPQAMQHFPPIFNGSIKCFRDMEAFNRNGFLCVNATPDGYCETRQEASWIQFCEQKHSSEKSNVAMRKLTRKVLCKGNSDSSESVEVASAFPKQVGHHLGESEDSGQSGKSTQDSIVKQSDLERFLEEEYQVAKNNAEERVDSVHECPLSLMKGTYLLSQVIPIPDEEPEPEIPFDLQGPGGHVFLRMLSRSWRQYKRALEQNE